MLVRPRAKCFGRRHFLHAANLWNHHAGSTFRCELLVNTQCSDEADDACFSSRFVSWSDCVPRETPLLEQPIDNDGLFSAKLDRYSGVVQESKGVEGQCCIPNCTRIFPVEHAKGWMCSHLKEHATNRNDVEKV